MFEKFAAKYKPSDPGKAVPADQVPPLTLNKSKVEGFVELMSQYSGATFDKGLYRVCQVKDLKKWTEIVVAGFPEFKGRVCCFSYDWLGRFFAVDGGRMQKGQPLILNFDLTAGEAYEIPATFVKFHDVELVKHAEDALAEADFEDWLKKHKKGLEHQDCVGLKVPLFLDGEFEPSNCEVNELETYWQVTTQLIAKTKDLPEGTDVGGVSIS